MFETYCVDKANEFNPGKFDLVHEMMPHYDEPKSGPKGDVDMNEYPIILTTGRRIPVYFHSEHRQLPWCRELWPAPRLEVNPEDAAELGLEQGDWAWIETEWGKVRQVRRFVLRHREGVGERRARLVVPRAARADARVRAVEHRVHLEPLRPGSVHRVVPHARRAREDIQGHARELPRRQWSIPCAPEDGTEIIYDASDPRLKEWLPNYTIREEA